MTLPLFWLNFRNYFRRSNRDPFGILIFVVLPVILVYVLSYVHNQNTDEQIYVMGYNMASSYIAVAMMLLFQLNGGIYLIQYLNNDLVDAMKWRLKASPCHTHTMIYGAVAACLLYTILQGILIVAITAFFMDAYWGNLWITVLVILMISIIAQLIGMILLIIFRNVTTAEYISWFIGWVMAIFGGMIFTLPDHTFFKFMKEYGTPFSLAQSAIRESGFMGNSLGNMYACLAALLTIIVALGAVVVVLGRRKLL